MYVKNQRIQIINGEVCWLVRDVGKALDYASNGGNLSRNMTRLQWADDPDLHPHLIFAPTHGGNDAWWVTRGGLWALLRLVERDEPKYYEAFREFMEQFERREQ